MPVFRRFLRALLVRLHGRANHHHLVQQIEPEGRAHRARERRDEPAEDVVEDVVTRLDARPADGQQRLIGDLAPCLLIAVMQISGVGRGDRGIGDDRAARGLVRVEELRDLDRVDVHATATMTADREDDPLRRALVPSRHAIHRAVVPGLKRQTDVVEIAVRRNRAP